jgi:uncharacterized protein (TIGR00255 family)
MTGHGEAHRHHDGYAVAVEVRTVNNRFFKQTLRASEGYYSLESRLESVVRKQVRRGSVSLNVRIDHQSSADEYVLNEALLVGYWRQLEGICERVGSRESLRIEALLGLPGVVTEPPPEAGHADRVWPVVEAALSEALKNLTRMRAEEGAAMAADLEANAQVIREALAVIESRAPQVVEDYRSRLQERLGKLLEEFRVNVQESDIVREVGVFADRSDISEEIVRLRSHLDQFQLIADEEESNGRKLEFVIQEMLRETNTIGSKANDSVIAQNVVEIKTAIERMREMIQNVE